MTTTLELTKKLIGLPSYVSNTQDETPMAEFLAAFLAETLPAMVVERQYITDSNRCNLILHGNGTPELFVLGHIDTVQPKTGWQTDPLKPLTANGNLYGLGAADMKGSLAAFLCALIQMQTSIKTDNLMVLLYVDEEYDFEGIRHFMNSKEARITPKLTLSLDGELAVGTGCRGLIEISLTTTGKSGHAANPANGNNAITGTIAALQQVGRELASFADTDLGPTTTNIAGVQGGVLQNVHGEKVWLREGNIIPDTAEVVFELRPASAIVSAPFVLQRIQAALEQRDLKLANSSVRHNIAPWPVTYDKPALTILKNSYAKAGVPFSISNRKLQGYIDAQMVAEKIITPTFIVGTGGNNKHGADENVPLVNLDAATKLYAALLQEMLA